MTCHSKTNSKHSQLATLTKLAEYIQAHAGPDVRPGESPADTAIRWHQELTHIRNMRVQRTMAEGVQKKQPEWRTRIDQCEAVIARLDELPERAEDFAEGVRETLEGIVIGIRERREVTAAQCVAIDNIERGVEKWIK